MYQSLAEMGGGSGMSIAEESALYDEAFEAVKILPPGVYTPDGVVRRVKQRYRYTVMAAIWSMVDVGLARFTPTYRVRILPPKEESNG